jgi:hypothetical protein
MSESLKDFKNSYGIVKLQKGTILYYYGYNFSNSRFTLSEELFLRTFFHPSDKPFKKVDENITVIELQKDITLIFMINKITVSFIRSCLYTYLDISNLEKRR